MANSGRWQPGQSGNPKGRPKKDRALTAILERAGSKTVEVDGKHVSGRNLLARLLWDLVKTGQAKFPDGRIVKIVDMDDLLLVAKFLYGQIDGPPKTEMEVTGPDGQPFTIQVVGIGGINPDDDI